MVASGVHWLWPTGDELVDWGANDGFDVALNHQYWRLFTNVFLHGGLIHVALNMWSLLVVGPLVERLYGNLAFAVIYLASGVAGAIASFASFPARVGVGASGAICGVLGALVAFLIVHRRSIPKSILRSFRGSLLTVVLCMALMGYFIPNIDHAAHLGGFVAGMVSGMLLSRPWPVVKSRRIALRRLVATFIIGGALSGLTPVLAHRGAAMLSAEARLQGIGTLFFRPILKELEAIDKDTPALLVLSRDRNDAEARTEFAQTFGSLIRRANANLARLRRVAGRPYPPLRTTARILVEAQSSQLSSLQAAQRYLETGDPEILSGSGGVRDELITAKNAMKSFQEQFNSLRESDLMKRQ